MTPKHIQFFIALVFFVLGGWAAIFPQHVIDVVLLPEYRAEGRILPFTIACFGAQALLSGLFAAFSRFTALTFLVYGIALLPFFAFNYYFTFHDPVFTSIGLIDAAGNIIMLGLCYVGWKQSKAAEQRTEL
ncbi:MAG: hypothetical protein GW808_14435 [Sphingomonadales bacterium]|nr:hypothetical protein [Sphingomonadales bacterium]PIX64162.1 MAG: hypothetical protein COZ43_12475 [Sphingomonadales bacterium CG_4_10_14_3_um_filter_58_15]NCO50375.1 hypothetical protein [Sphingomonadales bacterium]NCO98662.1 hypothetical protein [Sphingomonadales bacterium]NCP26749.1 hypothetical protein [Sphingomonadales bacterium]